MKNKIISVACIFAFTSAIVIAPVVQANELPPRYEAVSPLDKGDKAPFEGILFSKDLAARIEAERKTMIALKLCEIRVDTTVLLAKSEQKLQLDILSGKYAALQTKHTDIIGIKDGQIKFLQESYMPPKWYESPTFLITVGVIVGIGLTIGTAHIVKTVRD